MENPSRSFPSVLTDDKINRTAEGREIDAQAGKINLLRQACDRRVAQDAHSRKSRADQNTDQDQKRIPVFLRLQRIFPALSAFQLPGKKLCVRTAFGREKVLFTML